MFCLLPVAVACLLVRLRLLLVVRTDVVAGEEAGGGEKSRELSVLSGDRVESVRFWEVDRVGWDGTDSGERVTVTSKLMAVAVDSMAFWTRTGSILRLLLESEISTVDIIFDPKERKKKTHHRQAH